MFETSVSEIKICNCWWELKIACSVNKVTFKHVCKERRNFLTLAVIQYFFVAD